jgi:hypothetical protein
LPKTNGQEGCLLNEPKKSINMQKKLNQYDTHITRYGQNKHMAQFGLVFLYKWAIFDQWLCPALNVLKLTKNYFKGSPYVPSRKF